jgi:hypothetical protein
MVRNFIVVLLGTIFGISVVLSIDFIHSNYLGDEKLIVPKDGGWYELSRSYAGPDQWGSYSYLVLTDKNGFRVGDNDNKQGKASLVFLGDSFTFGINGPWRETFVGMCDQYSKNKIINAGVPSYSPVGYLHQYKKILNADLIDTRHTLIIGLDISDVQDEASVWIDGNNHPIKRKNSVNFSGKSSHQLFSDYYAENFRKSYFLYKRLKLLFGFDAAPKPQPFNAIINLGRSAFTWKSWEVLNNTEYDVANSAESGYAPLGVGGGLQKIQKNLIEIADLANKNRAELYILLYPWPAQIAHKSQFSWQKFAIETCKKIKCKGVIDPTQKFIAYSNLDNNWYKKLYIEGDVHFTTLGNKLIFNSLKNEGLCQ